MHTIATFSICALDPASGEAGVAVSSACLAVGSLVPAAAPGAGAIASQAFVNTTFGPRGLDRLRHGVSADEVVRRLTEHDITITSDSPQNMKFYEREHLAEEGADYLRDRPNKRVFWFTYRIRQLGIVDRNGHAAVYNGARLPDAWASTVGDGFCCQGNTLADKACIDEMAAAYRDARDRSLSMLMSLMAALRAGQAGGGDRRGKRSAAVLVVKDRGHWGGGDRYCDARVDDDDAPVAALQRLAEKYENG